MIYSKKVKKIVSIFQIMKMIILNMIWSLKMKKKTNLKIIIGKIFFKILLFKIFITFIAKMNLVMIYFKTKIVNKIFKMQNLMKIINIPIKIMSIQVWKIK